MAGDLFRQETAIARVESWVSAIQIWRENPVLGVGFNMYRYVDGETGRAGAGVDNSFLFVLATTGIIGLLAYLNMWRTIIKGKYAIVAVLFTHAMFNNALFYPWVMWWLFISSSSSGE